MAETMLVKEAAKLWDLTERRVTSLCKEGKIKGARKQGHSWHIPVDAEKPADNRVKSGVYKMNSRPINLPLPIGVSDFRLACSEYYYVDKTMMIKDFIDERPMVSLFTRPRRFGKTLNMDMFCTFFENKEISFVYNKEILQKLDNMIPQSTAISIQEAIYSGDSIKLQSLIQMLLMQSASFYDTVGENFYHGFMLGLCALMGGSYTTSNRESGDGRYDIQMMPKSDNLPGILIELKAEKNCTEEELKKLSEVALEQIADKKYDTDMKAKGVETTYKYGVAFSGKRVAVSVG